MSFLRVLPRAAAFAIAFAISAHSAAYCLTYTCDPKKEDCMIDPETGCNIGGTPLVWKSSVVSFDVQQDGSKRQDISYDQLHTVVTNAFQRWVDAVCSDGNHPSISLADFGPVACAKPEYNKDQPNQNVITFHDSEWPYKNTGAETLALTTVFFNPDSGEIYDANIELNSYDANFVLSRDEADAQHDDLNAVLTHEIGHFLGLSHSGVWKATMFQSYDVDMTDLHEDDVAAICASLPPDRVTADPGNPPGVPRHGFSRECASTDQGCCASTIGGRAPSTGSLALWAFGLGLVTLGARGRAKARNRARARR
ncbi:MAG TPA: matrixin family metalloprotease [Polyangiaceae bacterium]|nr:matrixin family metalloprotease [Polyangiaceae bacterium]